MLLQNISFKTTETSHREVKPVSYTQLSLLTTERPWGELISQFKFSPFVCGVGMGVNNCAHIRINKEGVL